MGLTGATFEVKVAAGAALLDRAAADWFRKVNPELIDSVDGEQSVLGQLYGEYWTGLDILRLSPVTAADNGFMVGPDTAGQQRVVAAWKSEVVTRRSTPTRKKRKAAA